MEDKAVIQVEGMHCGNCAGKVKGALCAVPGVSSADVDLAGKKAEVRYDPATASVGKLMSAVTSAGFKATGFARTA